MSSSAYVRSMWHAVAFSSSAEVRMVMRLLPCPRMATVTLSIPSSASTSSSSSASVTWSSGSTSAERSNGGITYGRYGENFSPRHLQMRPHACSMNWICGSSGSSASVC